LPTVQQIAMSCVDDHNGMAFAYAPNVQAVRANVD
jgi:hypothetical protein